MPRSPRLERVKGVNDVLPPACAQQREVESHLLDTFAAYGYSQIDTPVLEHTDLYLRKAGEDTLARLYSFTYQNRKLSLRPELTASVVRAAIEHLQAAPLPVRLSYSGPVFRYESPQHSRYRQFTQTGLELLGASGAAAEAEVIALAVRGLDALGVRQYRLVIGQVGVLLALLRSLGLDERLVTALAAGMETLMERGAVPLLERLVELFPQLAADTATNGDDEESLALAALVQSLGEDKARTAVLELLGVMNVGLEGSRSREEIVDRVLAKFGRTRQRPEIEHALDLMAELGRIKGAPDVSLDSARALLQRQGAPTDSVAQLGETLAALQDYGVSWERVSIDFALSRGLQYYTGLLFEIYHDAPIGERQLCGGGRYDDLAATLGATRDMPAIGFAYGLERVLLALEAEGALPAARAPVEAIVVPVDGADRAYAVLVADALRSAGHCVELDVRGRGVRGSLQHAGRVSVPFVVIVGSREREAQTAVVRTMATHQENTVALDSLRSNGLTSWSG